MFGSQVLEVALGLAFVYLVLSIICSGIKEAIAGAFSLRSKTLEQAIGNMLNDHDHNIADRFYTHPLIARTARPGGRPAYIPASNFALALFETIAPPPGSQPKTTQDLRDSVASLPDCSLRRMMLGFLGGAENDLETVRKRVETWFDETMKRVSGWYKRKAQIIILATGLVLCAVLNADTFMIVGQLWNDQAIRNVVVAEARAEASRQNHIPDPNLQQIQSALQAASTPPMGWNFGPGNARGFPPSGIAWLEKVIGILISVVAVSMGAPFWFDLVNKLVNVRLSGEPPRF